MDQKSLQALEFPKILNNLSNYAVNELSKNRIRGLYPTSDVREINSLQDQLDEAVALVLRNGNPPISKTNDIRDYLSRAKIDSILNPRELTDISDTLRIIQDLIRYFNADEKLSETQYLKKHYEALNSLEELEKKISRIIIGPDEIADNASRTLAEIRRKIKEKQNKISKYLDKLINSASNEKYLQEKLVSIRNGRYVVPVKSEYRSKIPGAVLDRSSTGQTLFIEPLSVLDINNEINELEVLEKKEINRILKNLTEEVALNSFELEENFKQLIDLDFLFAKALYGLAIDGNRAQISKDGSIRLKKARHPLIDKSKVVASDIELPYDLQTLVITGPNTGGKTVTLKTLGLLSLMFQSGLYIPVRNGSRTKVFSNVFADIGDEQSIEQNLSTFSSHMTNIVDILKNVDENSLVLFDELGAGTDPIEGAALAVSILDHLKDKSGLTVATTHYPEIKHYGLTEAHTLNASVEFDVATLKPTYRLIIGLPGKSNAFEIARRLGISEEIILNSQNRVENKQSDLEETLSKAQEELIQARDLREEAESINKESSSKAVKIQEQQAKLEDQKKKILDQAYKEAQEIVEKTKKETDKIYKDIHKIQSNLGKQIDNKKLEALRRELNEKGQKLQNSNLRKYQTDKVYTIDDFKEGDRVYIKSLDREADIIKVSKKEKKVEIHSGSMRIKLKPKDLVKIDQPRAKKKDQISFKASPGAKGKMSTRLDLRGKTAEEAYTLFDNFINEAILLGHHKLEVIHGYGTGKVRKVVHDYLKKTNLVESYRLGGPGEGGSGATIITL